MFGNTGPPFDDPLPEEADVVVVGAGIVGVASAWFLTRAGARVLLCEKGRVAAEQSSRNWGWVRQQGRDAAELPLMMRSMRIWEGLARETGEDLGFARCGVVYLAESESELARYEQWQALAREHELDTRVLNATEATCLVGDVRGHWLGALYTPGDARAEPFQAVPALARALQRAGCRIVEHCAVRALECQAGEVSGVVTERGRVRAAQVVCAAGAWSSWFTRHAGVDFPQLSVKSTVARTAPAREVFDGNAAMPGLAFRRRADGGYTVALGDFHEHYLGADTLRYLPRFLPALRASWKDTRLRLGEGLWRRLREPGRWDAGQRSPFEERRVLDPPPSQRALLQIRGRLARRVPALAGIGIEQSWAGMIDSTPDFVPVIDRAPGLPGLVLASGFSGHGFGIGPGAGEAVADLVLDRRPAHDLTRFRWSRFSDGSPVQLGPL